MHDITFLGEILAVVGVAVVVVFLGHKLRVPTIVGFLVAGLLVGPGGFGLLADRGDIELIAEIGVALLLFTVGLEVSLRDLVRLKGVVFGGGGAQVGLTLAVVAGVAVALGVAAPLAVLVGALVALSSTAIVLKLLSERGETGSIHGRTVIGVLIFQDLAFVPLLLLVPLLAGASTGVVDVLLVLGKAVGVLAAMGLVAWFAFPWLLERVVRSRNRELFTLTVLVVALGTAYVTGLAGLSLPLGAFLAGVVVSETDYGHQVLSEITPLRDAFNSLFFISIGMLIDPATFLAAPLLVLGLVGAVLVVKTLVTGIVALTLGLTLRLAILVGFTLAQVGEFSFVIAQVGVSEGLLRSAPHQLFLTVSIVTMLVTPLLVHAGHALARMDRQFLGLGLHVLPRPFRERVQAAGAPDEHAHLDDHVIVVGYGVSGRNVARVLRKLTVPHVAVELNAQTVRTAREAGEPVVYGDATRRMVLEHVGVERARAVVVTLPDPAATRQIVAVTRALSAQGVILVRTRYEAEVDELHELGADAVVPEEFESSLALAGAVMETYGASAHIIDAEKKVIRTERYALLRERGQEPPESDEPTLSRLLAALDVRFVCIVGPAGEAVSAGRTLRELDLRARTGASVIAVVRGAEVIANPTPDTALRVGDHVALLGSAEQLDAAQAQVGAALGATVVEAPPLTTARGDEEAGEYERP